MRPTLFLAQLSNLLAGNISIVHGVTGASRTFMGEESAGVDAIRIAHARIAAGQAEIFLVGGAYNAERPDVLLIYEMGGFLWKKAFRSVWERPAEGGGLIPGSAGAFLVLESREHARGARRKRRSPPSPASAPNARGASPGALRGRARRRSGARSGRVAGAVVLSGATGVAPATDGGAAALPSSPPGCATIHAIGDLIGHSLEAQAPAGAVLARRFAAGRGRRRS